MPGFDRFPASKRVRRIVVLAIALSFWSVGLIRPALAQTFVQQGNTITGTLGNGDTFTLTEGDGTFTITAQGAQPFSITGTFSTNIGTGGVTQLVLTGTETIGNTTQQLNCTLNVGNGTFSETGQCGLFQIGAAATTPLATAIAGTSHATARAQVQSMINILSNRIGSISRDIAQSRGGGDQQSSGSPSSYSGLSAGTAAKDWGVWADGSGSYLRNDSSVAAFRGYGVTTLTGIDYVYRDTWVAGFTGGYVRTDVAVSALQGSKVSQGAALGPYLSYIINDHFTVDGIFTYNRLSNDTGGIGASSFNSNRYTTALNVNAFWESKAIKWTGTFGYAYALELPSASAPASIGGVPTTIHYGAISIGGEAAYPIGRFEPYIPLTFQYETTQTRDGTGRAGVLIGAGARYQIQDTIKAGFQVLTEQLRTHSQNVTGSANLRFTF